MFCFHCHHKIDTEYLYKYHIGFKEEYIGELSTLECCKCKKEKKKLELHFVFELNFLQWIRYKLYGTIPKDFVLERPFCTFFQQYRKGIACKYYTDTKCLLNLIEKIENEIDIERYCPFIKSNNSLEENKDLSNKYDNSNPSKRVKI